MHYETECQRWLSSTVLSEDEKKRVSEIMETPDTAALYFSAPMSFGTAGLRSTMDMGPGCMNNYAVAHITEAISRLIEKEGQQAKKRGVAIAYDSRHHSKDFAIVSAEVLAAHGISAYLFDDIRPTPELSFAIRQLNCIAGINITASHNPKQYNGYKAYWEDGAQISPLQASVIADMAAEIDILNGAKRTTLDQAIADGVVTMLGEDFDELYLLAVEKTSINRDCVKAVADRLSIVYTPLHGAGRKLVPAIMKRMGLKHIYLVEEQMQPDGDFPTVKKPNPEYSDVFSGGIEIANRVGSDLVIATDPDADRVGVMCRGKDGQFFTVSGNQMGALLLDYVICAAKESGHLTKDDYAVKSIVSTDLANRICEVHGVRLYDVPPCFKYIGEVIKGYEIEGKPGRFLLGFEESYGYLFGSYARDKDAVGAAMMICEMTAWYAAKGMNLGDALVQLYQTYGYYKEGMLDVYMEGLDGIKKRKRVMDTLRGSIPVSIGGVKVAEFADFSTGIAYDMSTNTQKPSVLKDLDVLFYTLENGDKVIVRPSGTEPKIKMYFLCHGDCEEALEQKIQAYTETAQAFCAD